MSEERLVGIVALADLERSIVAGGSERTVGDVMTTAVETTFPAETLRERLRTIQRPGCLSNARRWIQRTGVVWSAC